MQLFVYCFVECLILSLTVSQAANRVYALYLDLLSIAAPPAPLRTALPSRPAPHTPLRTRPRPAQPQPFNMCNKVIFKYNKLPRDITLLSVNGNCNIDIPTSIPTKTQIEVSVDFTFRFFIVGLEWLVELIGSEDVATPTLNALTMQLWRR
ncbi:unnamed protein product [Colias eurytheme]|nr:unnamed protein product [Colias eurytheme]